MILTNISRGGEIDTSPKSYLALFQLRRTTLKKFDLVCTRRESHTRASLLRGLTTIALTCIEPGLRQLIVSNLFEIIGLIGLTGYRGIFKIGIQIEHRELFLINQPKSGHPARTS